MVLKVIVAQPANRIRLALLPRSFTDCGVTLGLTITSLGKRWILPVSPTAPQYLPLRGRRRKRHGGPDPDQYLAHAAVLRTSIPVGPGPPGGGGLQAKAGAAVDAKVLARPQQLGSAGIESSVEPGQVHRVPLKTYADFGVEKVNPGRFAAFLGTFQQRAFHL